MCMQINLFCRTVAVQSAFDVLCLSATSLSFPKQTVVMSGAKDLGWEVVSLGRLNAPQTKILGLGKVKIVTRSVKSSILKPYVQAKLLIQCR